MDRLANEVFYYGAAVAAIIASIHLLDRRDRWKALSVLLLAILIVLDGYAWHAVNRALEQQFRPRQLDALIEHWPESLTLFDYVAPLLCIGMVAFAELERFRYAELAFLLGAIGYTSSVCAYWNALRATILEGGLTRDAIETICVTIGGSKAIGPIVDNVLGWYGGYAIAAAGLGAWSLRRGRVPWGLIAYAEIFGILVYVSKVVCLPLREPIAECAAVLLLILSLYWGFHYRRVIAKVMAAARIAAVRVARVVRREVARGLRVAGRVAMRAVDALARSALRAGSAIRVCFRKQRLRIKRYLRRRRPRPRTVAPGSPPD